MTEPTLHPNLAKLAAAYDEILDRMGRGLITAPRAREEIAQLEARDDQGVRWNIDPDTGEWVRKTAMGEYEYDSAPPTFGYMTPDAFDYTHEPAAFNPSEWLQVATVNEGLEHSPATLAGSTRAPRAVAGRLESLKALLPRLLALPGRTKAIAAVLVVALLAVVLYACAGTASSPEPDPQAPAPTQKPDEHSKPKHKAHPKNSNGNAS